MFQSAPLKIIISLFFTFVKSFSEKIVFICNAKVHKYIKYQQINKNVLILMPKKIHQQPKTKSILIIRLIFFTLANDAFQYNIQL